MQCAVRVTNIVENAGGCICRWINTLRHEYCVLLDNGVTEIKVSSLFNDRSFESCSHLSGHLTSFTFRLTQPPPTTWATPLWTLKIQRPAASAWSRSVIWLQDLPYLIHVKIYTLSLNIWMSYKHLASFIWKYRVYVYCGSPVLNMLCTHIGADAALSRVSSLRAEHSLEHMNCNFPPTIHLLYGPFEGKGGLRLPHPILESDTNIQYFFSLDAQQIQSFALSLRSEVATFSRVNPIENVLQSCLWLIFRAWRKIWNIACGPRRDQNKTLVVTISAIAFHVIWLRISEPLLHLSHFGTLESTIDSNHQIRASKTPS